MGFASRKRLKNVTKCGWTYKDLWLCNILVTGEKVMTNLLNVGFDAGWDKKIK